MATGLVLAAAACSGSKSSDDAGRTPATNTTKVVVPVRPDDTLKLNQIQVIGTHNSFHLAAEPDEYALLEALNPDQAAQRTYTHLPLPAQLETEKIRQIELDVFVDTKGGLYADPALRRQAGLPPLVEAVPDMAKPGIKVLHEQDVDYHSVCPTLRQCLTEVKTWSDANPSHVPVAINIQFKDGPLIFAVDGQAVPEKWVTENMDRLDAEILEVFPQDQIITPDDVRGTHATLEEAVKANEWPTLGESRGKVMFLMINAEPYRSLYLEGHPGLAGRILFTNAEPGQPDASYMSIDDPVADGEAINMLVNLGYMVRTRADEPDKQARTGDTTMRDAALKSGAQWISTDYPAPYGATRQYGNNYQVQLPGFVAARCNPVTGPKACVDDRVEPAG